MGSDIAVVMGGSGVWRVVQCGRRVAGVLALASSVGWSCASGRGANVRGVRSPLFPETAPVGAESVVSRFASRTECYILDRPRRLAGVHDTNAAGRWLSGAMLPIAPRARGVRWQVLWVELYTAWCLCVRVCVWFLF